MCTGRRRAINCAQILSRVLDLIWSTGDQPLRIDDLCRAADVSERTLRNIFYRHFGIGPHEFLTITRLNRVRAAIRGGKAGRDDQQHLRQSRNLGFRQIRRSVSAAVWGTSVAEPR